jgi:hypothetical protein
VIQQVRTMPGTSLRSRIAKRHSSGTSDRTPGPSSTGVRSRTDLGGYEPEPGSEKVIGEPVARPLRLRAVAGARRGRSNRRRERAFAQFGDQVHGQGCKRMRRTPRIRARGAPQPPRSAWWSNPREAPPIRVPCAATHTLCSGAYLRYTRPSVVTAGRPEVPTTTTFTVCLALLDQVLVQIASRYFVVEDFRSTVAVFTPST